MLYKQKQISSYYKVCSKNQCENQLKEKEILCHQLIPVNHLEPH